MARLTKSVSSTHLSSAHDNAARQLPYALIVLSTNSAMSACMVVTGLKGLAGFAVNARIALANPLEIVVAIARWMKLEKSRTSPVR